MGDNDRPICSFTERERQILRLLGAGHDAKSIARVLDLSVHTVNERLRSARHKARVASSREAARVLAHQEGLDNSAVYDPAGVAAAAAAGVDGGLSRRGAAAFRRPSLGGWTGAAMISLALIGAAALIARSNADAAPPPAAPPHVVATNPAPGAVVPAGPLRLSVTFDRPMRSGNYSFVQVDRATYPQCGDNRPTQSSDGRTFTLQCALLPHHEYEMWFNSEPYMNFKSVDGTPAVPFQLKFRSR